MKHFLTISTGLMMMVAWTDLSAQPQAADSATRTSDRATAWTSRTFTPLEIRDLPSRNLSRLISLSPGMVYLDADRGLYGRGSRNAQVGYRVNGMSMLDRSTNGFSLPFIPEAVQAVTVHTGSYGASLGSSPGGMVELEWRRGGDQWEATAQHLTDDLAPTGSTFLGTSSYGQHTSVVTAGGPLPFDTRLFVAAELHRMRDRDPRWVSAFSYELPPYPYTASNVLPVPGPLTFRTNHTPSTSLERSSLMWNLTALPAGVDIRFWGMMTASRQRDADMYAIVRNHYRQSRIPWLDENRTVVGVSGESRLFDIMTVKASVARDVHGSHTTDPDFGEDWRLYSDSVANAAKGYGGFVDRYYSNPFYGTGVELYFAYKDAPNNTFARRSSDVWRTSVELTARITSAWVVTAQAEAEWWTLRRFSIWSAGAFRSFMDTNLDGVDDRSYANAEELERAMRYYSSGFGYDVIGDHEIDDGLYGPRRPSFGSLVLSSRWNEGPLSLEVGMRAEHIKTDVPTLKHGDLPSGLWSSIPTRVPPPFYNTELDPSAVEPAAPTVHWLPRISVGIDEGSVSLYASWGRFLHTMSQWNLQIDRYDISNLLVWRQEPWDPSRTVLTSAARPELTTAADAGFRWRPREDLTIAGAVFVKSMTDQLQLGWVPVDQQSDQPVGFVNTGESRAIGFEASAEWRPAPSLDLSVAYGFLQARGRNSTPRGNFLDLTSSNGAIAPLSYPLDYEQAHRFIGQVRFTGSESSWAEGASVWVTARAQSGHPYTKESIYPTSLNLAPWYMGVLSVRYPEYALLEEPRNASVTPWTFTIDLTASYAARVGPVSLRAIVAVTNLLNTKQVVNVYATTGSDVDDGWLTSGGGANWLRILSATPYASLYRDLNLRNRYAYTYYTGNDIYAAPRQVRIGIEVGI